MIRFEATFRGIEIRGRMSGIQLRNFKSAVPKHHRNFVWDEKIWIADNSQQQALRSIFPNPNYKIAFLTLKQAPVTVKMFRIYYIGSTKIDYSNMARGTINPTGDGEWVAIFPKQVLEDWFSFGPPKPPEKFNLSGNFYQKLGLTEKADSGEIKKAYRKLAKKFHPDLGGDGDKFKIIATSYKVLSDPKKKKLYDAGIALENMNSSKNSRASRRSNQWNEFSPPQRCGDILAKGESRLGLFFVNSILKWNQIQNDSGKILETKWDSSLNKVKKYWI